MKTKRHRKHGNSKGAGGGESASLLLGALGLGAGLMYAFDPEKGRRRRALMRDKALHGYGQQRHFLRSASRDLWHRIVGAFEELRGSLADDPTDDVLVERVRSQLGRWVSHPAAIDVMAEDGLVILSGPILAREADHLLRKVAHVRGVMEVEDELERHEQAGDNPALQGRGHVAPPMWMRDNWTPALRLVALGSGSALGAYGLARGDWPGRLLALGGGALALRAATNLPTRRLLGVGSEGRAVDVRKSVYIEAPREEVFGFFNQLENFPRVMEHVREVHVMDGDPRRSHWKVDGPAGIPVGFDVEITELVPDQTLAWRTLPDQLVEHAGSIEFEEEGSGTRVHCRMSYSPPGGALAHAVLELLGDDPRARMDEDFMRLKSLFEYGKTRAHGEPVTLDELGP